MANVFTNVSASLANASSSWVPHEIEDLAAGHHQDGLHVFVFFLGLSVTVSGQRLPQVLSAVSAISFGIWFGLVLRDRQRFGEPFMGKHDYPHGVWFPVVFGILAVFVSAALVLLAWQPSLALLTSGLVMLLVLAFIRMFNVSPERIVKIGASTLSAYRIAGVIVLGLAFLVSLFGVVRCHKLMIRFTSACLGSMLLLSGFSHFCQRLGVLGEDGGKGFSLLDDLARMLAEVRGGRCAIWRNDGTEDDGLRGCDCSELCRVEIVAWFSATLVIFAARLIVYRYIDKLREQEATAEEKEHLTTAEDFQMDISSESCSKPVADVVGAKHDIFN